jgi:hypothetical protein
MERIAEKKDSPNVWRKRLRGRSMGLEERFIGKILQIMAESAQRIFGHCPL